MALRLRLIACDELEERLALLLDPLVERQVDRGTHGVCRRERRLEPASLLGQRRHSTRENRTVGLRRRKLAVVVTQFAKGALFRDHLAGKGLAARGGTFDDLVDQ